MPSDWAELIHEELDSEEFSQLEKNLSAAYEELGELIQPAPDNVFKALRETSVEQVRVVLLGQDPYQTPGLAQGLAFSIPATIKPGWRSFPSSLRNISKAIALDGYSGLQHGDLSHWAKQGVLLLNATLTVQLEIAGSHANFGWQKLTDCLLYRLALKKPELIWLLWGAHAQKKKALIEQASQTINTPNSAISATILTASHPSGLSVYRTHEPFLLPGDTGSCQHFKKVNELLEKRGEQPITWS
ncbi:uracil-DNA glycosylase [Polynucleobacter sp. 30F-ANTBAC]|jgi:uracil-DNA glycosylase|uniref:uracil-DNA glycosylase n=1 Tax=Polynucleobacter sp. 30F-ANTBAC TaxID=2689095 RepID=UPI001C0BC60A|nr:uracil-DNA glycosylase [Polynucleobacter sp. 30F-ANTBAC]MBU3599887.1 uracil-DNA glycosylase [Polynucleobacter sp. 30F-ANTBAC]